jgi:Yip1 domain
MDTTPPEVLPDAAAVPPPGSALSRLARVFYAPGEVFTELRTTPTWVAPLIAIVLLSVIAQLVIIPRLDMERTIREAMAQRSSSQQLSDEQMERFVAQAEKFKWVGPAVATVLSPLVLTLIAGLYFLGLRAFGSEIEYKPVLATYLYATWPASLVATVLTLVVALQRASLTGEEAKSLVKAGADALLPASASPVLQAVASVFSVFNLWQWILLVVGLGIVTKVKRSYAVTLVAAVWGLWLLLKVGGALLKTAF